MSDKQNIHWLYKKLGETPNECIARYKKENPLYENEPMTYAGRLDPMAEGLLLVLSGPELNEKDDYLELQKSYTFEILWGFLTDTQDILGLVVDEADNVPTEELLIECLQKYLGRFEQLYPAYSSRPVMGKPLFEWAREGGLNAIQIPTHEVEAYSSEFVARRLVPKEVVLEQILTKVDMVQGDFRQEAIKNKWKEIMANNQLDDFVIDTVNITVSSGFYVRQFVTDLAAAFQSKACVFHIKRTAIGDHSI